MHTATYISTYRGAMSLHTQYQHPNATHPSTWAGKFLESVPIFGLTKQTFPDCHLVLGQGFRVQGLDPGGHVQVCANKGSRLSAPKCAWLVMISGSGVHFLASASGRNVRMHSLTRPSLYGGDMYGRKQALSNLGPWILSRTTSITRGSLRLF